MNSDILTRARLVLDALDFGSEPAVPSSSQPVATNNSKFAEESGFLDSPTQNRRDGTARAIDRFLGWYPDSIVGRIVELENLALAHQLQ
jgi:hypothetical protein